MQRIHVLSVNQETVMASRYAERRCGMKLIININEQDFNYANNGSNYPMDISTKNRILSAIRNGIPYEEKPQGEWINREHYQVDEDGYDTMTCNKCGVDVHLPRSDDYDFCPNCGADMRGAL
jgi:hypothetical protein